MRKYKEQILCNRKQTATTLSNSPCRLFAAYMPENLLSIRKNISALTSYIIDDKFCIDWIRIIRLFGGGGIGPIGNALLGFKAKKSTKFAFEHDF